MSIKRSSINKFKDTLIVSIRACLKALLRVIQNLKNLDHFKRTRIPGCIHSLKINQNFKLLNYSLY